MGSHVPSWEHYGTHDDSAYPELWDGCIGAWAPFLGAGNLSLVDYSGWGKTEIRYPVGNEPGFNFENGVTSVKNATTGYYAVDVRQNLLYLNNHSTAFVVSFSSFSGYIIGVNRNSPSVGDTQVSVSGGAVLVIVDFTAVSPFVVSFNAGNVITGVNTLAVSHRTGTGKLITVLNGNLIEHSTVGYSTNYPYSILEFFRYVNNVWGISYGTGNILSCAIYNGALGTEALMMLSNDYRVLYTPRRPRRWYSIPTGFPFWARPNSQRILGGGLA